MNSHDFTQRFSFDAAPIRGRLVRLESTWQTLSGQRGYGPVAASLLADLAVAAGLLSQDLKVDGSLTIQLHPGGDAAPIRTAMAECRGRAEIRGIIHGDPAREPEADLRRLFGGGQLAITMRPLQGEPYQGRIALGGGDLAAHLEGYFVMSEQLPTRLWLTNDGNRAAGLMLQRLPGAETVADEDDDWRRLTLLADTLRPAELLNLAPAVLLQRLYHEDRVRLQPPAPLAFGCSCTRQRSANALRMLGAAEVEDILADDGQVTVTCEFCGATYAFDAVDARLALKGAPSDLTDPPIH
jgi:molecular chaperone Hsp33